MNQNKMRESAPKIQPYPKNVEKPTQVEIKTGQKTAISPLSGDKKVDSSASPKPSVIKMINKDEELSKEKLTKAQKLEWIIDELANTNVSVPFDYLVQKSPTIRRSAI